MFLLLLLMSVLVEVLSLLKLMTVACVALLKLVFVDLCFLLLDVGAC